MLSFAINDDYRFGLQCHNGSNVAATPTGTPTWRIYSATNDSDETSLLTGSFGSSDADSQTGYRTGIVSVTAVNGFASGGIYRMRKEWVSGGNTYAIEDWFRVL